jgi:predicted RNA polymerase sigma factor
MPPTPNPGGRPRQCTSAVIGELHFRLGQRAAAAHAWQEALNWTTARTDQELLRRRLTVCEEKRGRSSFA